jgi:hypothetical protein
MNHWIEDIDDVNPVQINIMHKDNRNTYIEGIGNSLNAHF